MDFSSGPRTEKGHLPTRSTLPEPGQKVVDVTTMLADRRTQYKPTVLPVLRNYGDSYYNTR